MAVPDDEPTSLTTVERLEDLPDTPPPADYVVIDVILASTTIVHLLANDVAYVKPLESVEAGLAFKDHVEDALLLGEQAGQPIEEFDVTPVPSVIDTDIVRDRPIGLLTSNGTRAIQRIGDRGSIYVGSTVNAPAVARRLANRDRETWLVAAGRQGSPTPEDSAGARLIAEHYRGSADDTLQTSVADQITSTATAEWLQELDLGADLERILAFGSESIVPRVVDGRIVADG